MQKEWENNKPTRHTMRKQCKNNLTSNLRAKPNHEIGPHFDVRFHKDTKATAFQLPHGKLKYPQRQYLML